MVKLSDATQTTGQFMRVYEKKTGMRRGFAQAIVAIAAVIALNSANAQSATGASTTKCDQTGQSLSCVTTTLFALPANTTLPAASGVTTFTLTGGAAGAPTCSSYSASPQTIPAITPTTINLTATCQTGATQTWSGVQTQSQNQSVSTAADQLTLVSGGSKTYTLSVCSSTQTTLCNTYPVTVTTTTTTQTPALLGCAISPASAQISKGSSPNLTVSCAQGTPTGYSWSLNNAVVSTAANYPIPSNLTNVDNANLVVTVSLSNSVSTASAGATYTTPPPVVGGSCNTFGDAARTINYSDSYIALNDITMGGRGATYILALNVGANDSSVGKSYLPVWVGTNSPVSQNGQRTVAVSLCPNDFGGSNGTSTPAQILASGAIDFAVNFTTEARRAGTGTALVQPGRTYYVNVRNDTCPTGGTCSLDGQYRNWNQ